MRTKGATSNVTVKLSDLNRLLNQNAVIPIARRFANSIGLVGEAMAATKSNINSVGNQPALEESIALVEVTENETTNP